MSERDVREALAEVLNLSPLRCSCERGHHDFCGRCIADYLLASDALAGMLAEAEQRGREDNADHGMCYVHGSKALDARLAEARAEAWRASRLDLAHELRESGAWAEVRMAEWVELRADRALTTEADQ